MSTISKLNPFTLKGNVSESSIHSGESEDSSITNSTFGDGKRRRKCCKFGIKAGLQDGWNYFMTVLQVLVSHPTWRMRKRQACVLASCLLQMGNVLPIFMSYSDPQSIYAQIYELNKGEVTVEVLMFLLDLTLLFTGYSGNAWWAIPFLTISPLYWIYQLYFVIYFFVCPPATSAIKYRFYDHIVRAVLYPYIYLVVYSAFEYLLTFVKMGFEYDPKNEHVPVITPESIVQMELIAQKQGMTAPEALVYIYKKTGQNWGVTATALEFDPNANLPRYRGT